MREKMIGGILAAGLTMLAAAPALAASGELLSGEAYETVDAQVERDGGVTLGPFSTTSAHCRKTGDSRAWVLERPRYGQVSIVKRKGEIAFGEGEPYAHCNDRPLTGTTIRYRPYRGFVGDDTFVFTIRFPDGEVRTKRVNAHVE
ncbi:hypothetical protein [Methylocystis parvus]|uniref:Uncharacterized protein n=1 Tax=Methylocystis parvus TaxID=134 RepID=A0A6B8MAK6_9HYPH|nr:hypothetical protein [Methylocystis parvus]QGM98599.1 hypothetical protein F7D14_14675 [Methylocystis parvus]WBK01057.1 hypothetical protein MMG94_04895 [Methylocystis parvus OBBP]